MGLILLGNLTIELGRLSADRLVKRPRFVSSSLHSRLCSPRGMLSQILLII